VVFIDKADLFRGQLVIVFILDAAEGDLVSMSEPNSLVVILEEFTLHANDLDLVQFGDIVGHFVALLHAVLKLVVLDELDIVAEAAIVILDALLRCAYLQRG